MRTLLTFALIIISKLALACSFDAECGLSERCIKRPGGEKGHCAKYDSGLRDPLDVTGPDENLCSYNIDCGLRGTCLAVGGLYGTCVGM